MERELSPGHAIDENVRGTRCRPCPPTAVDTPEAEGASGDLFRHSGEGRPSRHVPSAQSETPQPPVITLPSDGRPNRRSAEYDQYFRLCRAEQELSRDTGDCLSVQDAVLSDLPASDLDGRERADLLAGLALLNRRLLREWLTRAPGLAGNRPPASQPAQPAPADSTTALYRWKLGHQLFHLHLRAMNDTLIQATDAARESRWPQLSGLLQELRVLYDAATAAMSYSAALHPDAYQGEVRPTMEPPFLSPGFSGLFNQEHRQTVRLLRRLRTTLEDRLDDADCGLPDHVRSLIGELAAAQARNHANHVQICHRFVPEGASLLRRHLEARRDGCPGREG